MDLVLVTSILLATTGKSRKKSTCISTDVRSKRSIKSLLRRTIIGRRFRLSAIRAGKQATNKYNAVATSSPCCDLTFLCCCLTASNKKNALVRKNRRGVNRSMQDEDKGHRAIPKVGICCETFGVAPRLAILGYCEMAAYQSL